MPNLRSPLEALAALADRLAAASTKEALPGAASRLGETFLRAADDVPSMFERGRSFADDSYGLASQFGVGRPTPFRGDGYDYFISHDPTAKTPSGGPSLLGSVNTPYQLTKGRMFEPIEALFKAKLLTPGRDYHVWDTSGLWNGSGQGTALYPAAFGMLRNLGPEAINVSEGLSGVNQLRRTYNQASALERDPTLARQILVAPSQLRRGGLEDLGVRGFHDLSPEQQVGVLQLAAARGALTAIKDAIEADSRRVADINDPSFANRQRHLDMQRLTAPMLANAPPDRARLAAELMSSAYQQSPRAAAAPLGERSLRKLKIVDSALSGASFDDLAQAGLFDKLEFARGGLVSLY